MITLFPILRQRIREAGVSWADLAAVTGENLFTIHMKMLGIKRWALTDVVKICGFFNTPDAEHLFVRNYNKQQFLESQYKNNQ
jgi:hypothetical protein